MLCALAKTKSAVRTTIQFSQQLLNQLNHEKQELGAEGTIFLIYKHDLIILQEWEAWFTPVYIQLRANKSQLT